MDISEGQENLQQTPTSTLHGNPKDLFTWSALKPIPERLWRLHELASTRPRQPTGQAEARPGSLSKVEQKMGLTSVRLPLSRVMLVSGSLT